MRAGRRSVYVVASAAYAGLLVYFSLRPEATPTESGAMVVVRRWVFNLLHVPAYAVLGYLFSQAMDAGRGGRGTRLWTAGGLAVGVGVVTELLQRNVPGRCADVVDGLLNTVGVAGAMYWVWRRSRREAGAAGEVRC